MDFVREALDTLQEHWIISTFLTVIILLYWHYKKNFSVFKISGIRGPTPLPLVGNSLGFILNSRAIHETQREHQRIYGKVYGLYLFKMPTIVVTDPEILKVILVKEFDKFHDRPTGGIEFPEPLASVLTIVTGQRWKNIRSILSPAFTSGKLKGMMYIMHKAGDVLLNKIAKVPEDNTAVDIHKWQQSLTMEVILSAAFGVESESQTNPDDKVTLCVHGAMNSKPFAVLATLIPLIGNMIYKKFALSSWGYNWSPVIDVAKSIIKSRKEPENNFRMDMLQNMLAAQHPEKKGHRLTENELIAEMILFLMAGYDTSSNVLTLSCYHLAIYPEIQDKVVEEIQRVCQSPDGVTYDEIRDLTYLDAFICETLRLYPPGFVISRSVNDSCTIKGITFKKGMGVLIPVYALHRDEEFWPEPDCFNPDRFLPENKGSINEFAYLPFGSGPRMCLGMRFALMEIKTILVKMLQQYRFVRVAETPVPLKVLPIRVLSPAEPVVIKFEKRS